MAWHIRVLGIDGEVVREFDCTEDEYRALLDPGPEPVPIWVFGLIAVCLIVGMVLAEVFLG